MRASRTLTNLWAQLTSYLLFFTLSVMISILLHGQENKQLSPQISVPIVNFPSPFSYHIVREVTAFHIKRFIKKAEDAGIRIKFLNTTEYSNIVHALAIRTGWFLQEGEVLIQTSAISQNLFTSSSTNSNQPFFLHLFDIMWTGLETLSFGDGFAEKPFIYLKDINGNSQSSTIHSMVIGVQTMGGEGFDISFVNGNLASLLFPIPLYSTQSRTPFSDILTYHVDQGLWHSFNTLLNREFPEDRNLQVTLYLKDLSSEDQNPIFKLEDVNRINIGVIVEDNNEVLQDLDWIIDERSQKPSYITNSNQMITAFHESAHELVRQALRDHLTDEDFLSIVPSLIILPSRENYKFLHTFGQNTYKTLAPLQTKQQYFDFIAESLAGEIAERMLFNNQTFAGRFAIPFISKTEDAEKILFEGSTFTQLDIDFHPDTMTLDMRRAWLATHIGVCVSLSYNEDECLSPREPIEWVEWTEQLPPSQKEIFDQERTAWILAANALAMDVLTKHAIVWVRLTRLLLQKGRLNGLELREFYQNPENTLISNSSVHFSVYSNLPPLPWLDILNNRVRIDHIGVSLQDVLMVLNATDTLDGIEMEVPYRYLSLGFALDASEHFERVKSSSAQDVFDQIKVVDVPTEFLPYIRRGPKLREIQPTYAQGLPALYFEYLIRTLSIPSRFIKKH